MHGAVYDQWLVTSRSRARATRAVTWPRTKYEYRSEASASIGIGIDVLGLEAKIRPSVSLNGSLALNYQLRGGFDYELRRVAAGHGLVWSLSNRKTSH
jgi:hypothetical protein